MLSRNVFLSQRKLDLMEQVQPRSELDVQFIAIQLPIEYQDTAGFVAAIRGLDQSSALTMQDQNKIINALLFSQSVELAEQFFRLNNSILNTYQCLGVMKLIKKFRKPEWLHFYFNERVVTGSPKAALGLAAYKELLYDAEDLSFSFSAQHFICMLKTITKDDITKWCKQCVAPEAVDDECRQIMELQVQFLGHLEFIPSEEFAKRTILQIADAFSCTIKEHQDICHLIQDLGFYQIILKSMEYLAAQYCETDDDTEREIHARAVITSAEVLEQILTYSQTNRTLLNSINPHVLTALIQLYRKNKSVFPSLVYLATIHMVQKPIITEHIFSLVVERLSSQSPVVRQASIHYLHQMTNTFQVEQIFNTTNYDVKKKMSGAILKEMAKLHQAGLLDQHCEDIIRALCVDGAFQKVFEHTYAPLCEALSQVLFQ